MRRVAAIVALALSVPLFASQTRILAEGLFTQGDLYLQSAGIGMSGPIKVSGLKTTTDITSLRIEAFGRSVQLSPAQLEALDGGHYNFIRLSYDQGYQELGGRTIYIELGKTLHSGDVSFVFIVLTEDGMVKVTKRL